MKRYAALLCCGVLLFWWLLPGSPAAVSAAEEPEIPAAAYAGGRNRHGTAGIPRQ